MLERFRSFLFESSMQTYNDKICIVGIIAEFCKFELLGNQTVRGKRAAKPADIAFIDSSDVLQIVQALIKGRNVIGAQLTHGGVQRKFLRCKTVFENVVAHIKITAEKRQTVVITTLITVFASDSVTIGDYLLVGEFQKSALDRGQTESAGFGNGSLLYANLISVTTCLMGIGKAVELAGNLQGVSFDEG